jgi:uncharacterized membrane protein
VLKRIKEMGLTLNFAHPLSHTIFGLLVIMIALIIFFGN